MGGSESREALAVGAAALLTAWGVSRMGCSQSNQSNDSSKRFANVNEERSNKEEKNIPRSTASKSRTADSSNSFIHVDKASPKENVAPVLLKSKQVLIEDKRIKHYCRSHKILLVGEGDFSFSTCLAKAFGTADYMIATSLNSIDFLQRNYSEAISNINELKRRGCMVIHDVDATEMWEYHLFKGLKFDRIIYNFPLAGFFRESKDDQLIRNQNLVKLFFINAKKMISKGGEIHVTHKSNGFFLEWNLEELANLRGLKLIEDVKFQLSDYPGYNNKYGFGGDKNFDCNPSRTYKFGIK